MLSRTRLTDCVLGSAVLLTVCAIALLHDSARASSAPDGIQMEPVAARAESGAVDIPTVIAEVFGDRAAVALCVAGAESGWRPDAVNVNDDGSRDRGVFQINSRWHPDIPEREAFNPHANALHAHRLSEGGADWSAWAKLTRARCGLT